MNVQLAARRSTMRQLRKANPSDNRNPVGKALTDFRHSLELFQVLSLRLLFQENFDPIGSPNRNPCSEEICVFRPNCTGKRQRRGQNWPVFFVPTSQTLPRICFEEAVCLCADRLDQRSQIGDRGGNIVIWFSPFAQQSRQILLCVGIGNFRCIKPDIRRRRIGSSPARP